MRSVELNATSSVGGPRKAQNTRYNKAVPRYKAWRTTTLSSYFVLEISQVSDRTISITLPLISNMSRRAYTSQETKLMNNSDIILFFLILCLFFICYPYIYRIYTSVVQTQSAHIAKLIHTIPKDEINDLYSFPPFIYIRNTTAYSKIIHYICNINPIT